MWMPRSRASREELGRKEATLTLRDIWLLISAHEEISSRAWLGQQSCPHPLANKVLDVTLDRSMVGMPLK